LLKIKNKLKMNKKIQFLMLAIGATIATNAQDLSTCKNVCEKKRIIETGPFIGIRFNMVANTKTVKVLEVLPNTAAQRSGFTINDVILKFENTEILNNQHLIAMVAAHQPGDKVNITYNHDGQIKNQIIALGALHSKEVIEKVCCDEPIAINPATNVIVTPNPATNNIILRSTLAIDGIVDVKIVDVTGVVLKTVQHNNRGLMVLPIDITELMSGNYFVKIQAGSKQFVEKLIVAK
jgi:membrane-associated protease RseP (regulator of RpoE activity)